MIVRPFVSFIAPLVLCAPALAQTHPACGSEHRYRWKQKVDTTLTAVAVETTTVGQMLAHWTARAIGHANWCTERADRETRVFTLVAWVRFVKEESHDDDWHVELTSNRASPRTSCIVAEIPSDDYGTMFAAVRDSFLAVTGMGGVREKGDTVRPPVKIRVTGPAFYDGWHGSATGARGHGHCNKSKRALWEIHPVYRIEHP